MLTENTFMQNPLFCQSKIISLKQGNLKIFLARNFLRSLLLILIRERKKEKQMEGKKTRGREKDTCAHSCRKNNFGTLLGKWMREEEANLRMLKYRHKIGFFSLGLLQFFLIGVQDFWFFCVLSFKFSMECGISCTVPDSAMPMQPDVIQMLD